MSVDWYALPICPRCFRRVCWTTRIRHTSRPMNRPHYERIQKARNEVR